MPTGPGGLDAQGVYQFGESDIESLASDLLNLGMASVSTQFGLDRGRLTNVEALAARVGVTCVVRKSANQNLTATAAPVTWDVEIADPAGMHSNTVNNSRLTAPVSGLYLVTCSVFNNNTSGLGTLYGRLNGSTDIPGSLDRRVGDASASIPLRTFFILQLTAGQYIELMVLHASAAGNIAGGTAIGSAVAMMTLVGPA